MAKDGKAVKRFNLSFTDTNSNACDTAIFEHIDMVKMSHRTDLYHNAFRSGILLAMIDERLPVIFATLASQDDPKKAFLSALVAVGQEIAWDEGLYAVGYRKRTILSEDQRKVIPNEGGYTVWASATKDEYTTFLAGGMPEGSEVEPLFAKKVAQRGAAAAPAPVKEEVKCVERPVAQEPKPKDEDAARARNLLCS